MQRRSFLRSTAGAIGSVGLLGYVSTEKAAAQQTDLRVTNDSGYNTVEYDIKMGNGNPDISGEIEGGADHYTFDNAVKFERVLVTGAKSDYNPVSLYPEALVTVDGYVTSQSGTCVVESLWKDNQYDIWFAGDVDGTSSNEWGDNHDGGHAWGSINEGKTDKWNFDSGCYQVRSFGNGFGTNRFTFNYD
ncbi:hypothetical protein [Haladaptatus sp. DJG-WS-42]|uniref:hypothetical protein n=1 Tax=Haladaptatus sp. DJG-WS-42 TaxID=3120516 RepID=UPI0030CD3D2D